MIHEGSKETYEYIGKWVSEDFFFSANDRWGRMGMLGAFGDFVCSCTPGAVAEIGCGESSIYLSHVARKYNKRILHCDIAPCKIINPRTVPGYFACEEPQATFFSGPSDDFFAQFREPLALVFIDGDHRYEQAKKDFWNAFDLVVEHGYIILHDTYPSCDDELSEHRCGDVYRLRQELQSDSRVDVLTLTRGTAMGVGMTIVRKRPSKGNFFHA